MGQLRALFLPVGAAHAPELEPRAYSNTPVGLNFLVAGYSYAEGEIAFDPTLPIADARYRNNAEVIAYSHAMDVWGDSAKFDVTLPYSRFSTHALGPVLSDAHSPLPSARHPWPRDATYFVIGWAGSTFASCITPLIM